MVSLCRRPLSALASASAECAAGTQIGGRERPDAVARALDAQQPKWGGDGVRCSRLTVIGCCGEKKRSEG